MEKVRQELTYTEIDGDDLVDCGKPTSIQNFSLTAQFEEHGSIPT